MKKVFFFAVALCLVASTAAFAGTEGRLGIGANYNQDINISYGLSSGAIIGGGLGFSSMDNGEDSDTAFNLGAFYQHPMVAGDNAGLYFEGAFGFSSYDGASADPDDTTWTVLTPHIGLTVYVWMGNNFSLNASHGLMMEMISPPGDGDSLTNFRTYQGDLTEVSFTFWMDAK